MISRTAPPKKRRSGKPRRGPMRDVKYRRWISQHPDILDFMSEPGVRVHGGASISQAAHTENNGAGSKGPDSNCVPLSPAHHAEYDAGREAFERKYNVNMREVAAAYYARYLEETK